MQDRPLESPIDLSSQTWIPPAADTESTDLAHPETPTVALEERDPDCLSDEDEEDELDEDGWEGAGPAPLPIGGTLHESSVEAGELTRGRRRDLESGTTYVDTLKIVYWGPGRSGKTTNLQWLHGRLRPELRGRLVSFDGHGERTLYFDCLPIDLAPSGSAPVRLRLYTVPGQPRFRLTRKLVLDGVDGIVFVWDSRSRRLNANLTSLIEMRETLAEMGIEWSSIPRVVQYNKLDLPERILPEELDHVLDRMGERVPRLRSVATRGAGVLDTLGAIASAALKRHRAWIESARPSVASFSDRF